MKIGVFGGTFDPFHNGHLQMALTAVSEMSLDRMLLIPNGTPPHKTYYERENHTADRVAMLELAIKDQPSLTLDLREIERGGLSYTYLTLQELKQEHPGDEIYYLIGEDSFYYLDQWVHPEIICDSCILLVARREEHTEEERSAQAKLLSDHFDADIHFISMDVIDVSSSEIRKKASLGESLEELVCAEVETYIKSHKVYEPPLEERLKEALRARLDERRLSHTFHVADTAVTLAMTFGADPKKAYIAGLFHDYCKALSGEEMLKFAAEHDIPVDETEKKAPYLLHGRLAAWVAKEEYGIEDEDLLNAIIYHTTGRPAMSLLEKIIYLADFIEPGRPQYRCMPKIRKLAETDIDQAVCETLRHTLLFLEERSRTIHPLSRNACWYFEDLCKKEKKVRQSS